MSLLMNNNILLHVSVCTNGNRDTNSQDKIEKIIDPQKDKCVSFYLQTFKLEYVYEEDMEDMDGEKNKDKKLRAIILSINRKSRDNLMEKTKVARSPLQKEYDNRVSDRKVLEEKCKKISESLWDESDILSSHRVEMLNEFDLFSGLIKNHKKEEKILLDSLVEVQYTETIDTYHIVLERGVRVKMFGFGDRGQYNYLIDWVLCDDDQKLIKNTNEVVCKKMMKCIVAISK